MRNKFLITVFVLFAILLSLIYVGEVWVGDRGRAGLQRDVSSSVLRYGTLGNILAELGLLSGQRPKGYFPVDASVIAEGEARLSFKLNADVPLGGHVFYWRKNEDGSIGEFEREPILTRKPGETLHAVMVFALDELFAFRIDIDTLKANIKLYDVELIDHNLRVLKLDSKQDYEHFMPNDRLKVHSVDESGIQFSTLASGDGDANILFNTEKIRSSFDGYAALFGRKRSRTDIAFSTNNLSERPADLSQPLIQHVVEQQLGLPILSISAPNGELDDEYGILTNLQERGREYERLVDISYYDATGNRVFASPVGIRYHGGYHRAKYDSYKLYFRSEYGSTENRQSLIFPDHTLPIRSLVLHHTQFPEFSPIGHLLAIDFFESIGVDTPRRQPVMVYLNNKELGFYYLTDHLSKRNFEAYLGTGNFRFYRFKSYNTPQDSYALNKDLLPIVEYKKSKGAFPEDYIYEHFDVEGITNFMVANTVFNTQDYCQGVLYRRDDIGDKKWRMVGWDFDGAFMKVQEWTVPRWEDTFNIVEEAYTSARGCPYQIVFRKLLANSKEYRTYFKEKFHESLETIFSTEAMKRRMNEYRNKYEGKLGVTSESFDMLEEYFEKRPAFIKEQTDKHLAYWGNLQK